MFNRLLEFVWDPVSQYEVVEPCKFTGGDGNRWEFGRRIVTTAEIRQRVLSTQETIGISIGSLPTSEASNLIRVCKAVWTLDR